jgi:hypothetical protein
LYKHSMEKPSLHDQVSPSGKAQPISADDGSKVSVSLKSTIPAGWNGNWSVVVVFRSINDAEKHEVLDFKVIPDN